MSLTDAPHPAGRVYKHTVAAYLTRVVKTGGALEEGTRAGLRALGINPDAPTDLDVHAWQRLVQLGARMRWPALPFEDAMREAGREMVRAYLATVVGAAANLALRLMGPRRALDQLSRTYTSADSVSTLKVQETGPTSATLTLHIEGGIPWPTYNQGLFEEVLRKVVDRPVSVTFERLDASTVRFDATWG